MAIEYIIEYKIEYIGRYKRIFNYRSCNVTITGPANHRLRVIFLATTMSSSLYHFIVTTILSFLYYLGYKSALTIFEAKVLCISCEPNKWFTLIAGSQKLLADQRFSKPGSGGAREVSSHSTKESHWRRNHE